MQFVEEISSVSDAPVDGMLIILQNLKAKYDSKDGESDREIAKMIGKAIQDLTNVTLTENGDRAYSSSLNALVDLYYKSLRNMRGGDEELRALFEASWSENPYLTMRLIAHIRDIRGGKGERHIGRVLLDCVAKKSMETLRKNARVLFHTYGRWDDGIFYDVDQYNSDKADEKARVEEEKMLRARLEENLKKKKSKSTSKSTSKSKNIFAALEMDENDEEEEKKEVEEEQKEVEKEKKKEVEEIPIPYSEELMSVYIEAVVLQLRDDMMALEKDGENSNISLCAKWIPSEKSKHGVIYKRIAKAYGMNSANFRKKVLVPLRRKLDILETKLCKRDYEAIDYEKVPSVAMNKHTKKPSRIGKLMTNTKHTENAFLRNDRERFEEYKSKLVKGEAKVNVSALFPHQIVGKYCDETHNGICHTAADDLIEAQWKAMVEEVEKSVSGQNLRETLVLADVSGSMRGMPMLISYTMGILISSIAKCNVWKDVVMTFEQKPRIVKVKGATLLEKLGSIKAAPWGGSTDFMAAMRLILSMAKDLKLSQDDLPKKILVVSDMQFNQASMDTSESSFEMISREFSEAGYVLPQMVFWNVRSTSTLPVMSGVKGVSLVSGYSPNVLKSVMEDRLVTPEETVMNAIMDKRYDLVGTASGYEVAGPRAPTLHKVYPSTH